MKEFFVWMRWEETFKHITLHGTKAHAIKFKLHEGFRHLGLRLAKSTENLSRDGHDRVL
jgi:hypothetical protein